MKKYGVKGQLSDTPQLGESIVVLAWEAEAAIAAAEQRGFDEGYDAGTAVAFSDFDEAAKRQCQRDMLAKCIAAVDALEPETQFSGPYQMRRAAVEALRAVKSGGTK
jgi:flagellar biosynthesis/type III secretory pathway protein FliH